MHPGDMDQMLRLTDARAARMRNAIRAMSIAASVEEDTEAQNLTVFLLQEEMTKQAVHLLATVAAYIQTGLGGGLSRDYLCLVFEDVEKLSSEMCEALPPEFADK